MQHILIYTLKNITDEEISGTFDGKPYAIPVGGTLDLPADVAGWYMDKHPGALEQANERTGSLAEHQDRATLTNTTDELIVGRFDGEDFTFEPGIPVPMHENTALWFMNTPPYAGKLDLGVRQPDAHAAEAPAEDSDESEDGDKPRKSTKKLKEAPKD